MQSCGSWGNQWGKTVSLSKLGKAGGFFLFAVGTLIDMNGVIKYKVNPNDPNAVSPAKATLNLGVGAYSFINPATATVGLIYGGVDQFYPGGWNAAMEKLDDMQNRNREIMGKSFNLYRDF